MLSWFRGGIRTSSKFLCACPRVLNAVKPGAVPPGATAECSGLGNSCPARRVPLLRMQRRARGPATGPGSTGLPCPAPYLIVDELCLGALRRSTLRPLPQLNLNRIQLLVLVRGVQVPAPVVLAHQFGRVLTLLAQEARLPGVGGGAHRAGGLGQGDFCRFTQGAAVGHAGNENGDPRTIYTNLPLLIFDY